MKIEKISNTQIKVILSSKDLEERNIKLSELAYSSDKTRELFRDMMDAAVKELGFTVENIPLMIEAIPMGDDEIMLIVSKVSGGEPGEMNLSMVPMAFRERNFERKYIEDMPEDLSFGAGSTVLYSFDSLDDVTRLCNQIDELYIGKSSLYKEDGIYYLIMSGDVSEDITEENFFLIVDEFGTRHTAYVGSKAYLDEHTELIIADKAVSVLSKL
jgi:adapter protein MecA 1/2